MNTLSDTEKRIGSLMARISAACIFLSFGVQVALGDPGSPGYDSGTGGIVAILNYAQAFSFLFVLAFSLKLFNAQEKPYFRVVIQAFFAVIAINMVNSFNATGYSNNDGTLFTPDQIQILQNINAWGWNILAAIAVLCVLSANNGELPTYGVYAGWGGSILILVFSFGSIFGLLPQGAFIVIALLGGVVLFPAFIFSFSSAFSKA